jgi:hypothetical protein
MAGVVQVDAALEAGVGLAQGWVVGRIVSQVVCHAT